MESANLEINIEIIKNEIGTTSMFVVRKILIGNPDPLEAAILYLSGLADKNIIDRDILTPIMLYINEPLKEKNNLPDYMSKKYIAASNSTVISDIYKMIQGMKNGKTVILIEGVKDGILVDTSDGKYRSISEPPNETAVRGSREGFVENLDINLSMIKRRIKERNLVIENFTLGTRTQSNVSLIYINDIAEATVINEIRTRLSVINVDKITDTSIIQQYIEDQPYSFFPQIFTTERPDVVSGDLTEGKAAILVEGSPTAITAPASFIQFFQAIEDYNQRTLVSSFIRLIRIIAVFIVITLPAIYLTLLKFNVELIPIKFITPIVESRIGIALTPLMEILSMEIIVEFLREGGLRLPTKIGQTLSVVGGIIIGDTAVRSKIVSPTTLFVVGIAVVANFLVPNYDMSLSVRILRFPMLLVANFLGVYGIGIVWFLILVHLCSMNSFGVPYLEFKLSDMTDLFIRAPLWKFDKRPESSPENNHIRETDFRKKWNK